MGLFLLNLFHINSVSAITDAVKCNITARKVENKDRYNK